MLSGITNTFSFCCVTVMFTVSTKTAIAFASLSLIVSSVRRSVILVKSSVPSSSVMTFPACRISSSDGDSFRMVRTALSISSKLLPEACFLSGSSSSGSSSPYSSSEVGMLVKVSSSFSSGTCAGRETVSVFPSSKVASSSDSSMPFYEVAASCVGMAAVVRVDAILKRLLPMMSEVSA